MEWKSLTPGTLVTGNVWEQEEGRELIGKHAQCNIQNEKQGPWRVNQQREMREQGNMALDTSPGHAPVPVGELALTGSHQYDVVDLVFNAEGVL